MWAIVLVRASDPGNHELSVLCRPGFLAIRWLRADGKRQRNRARVLLRALKSQLRHVLLMARPQRYDGDVDVRECRRIGYLGALEEG